MKICTAFVTYNKYGGYDWTKICVGSFRQYFPNEVLLVVDHNHNSEEREFLLNNNVVVVENNAEQTHGKGLDVASKYARNNDFDAIIFIEPDCIISGIEWYNNLVNPLENGRSMCATFQWQYGPLHPCGSSWLISDIPASFQTATKTAEEIFHPKYKRLMKLPELSADMLRSNYDNHLFHFFMYHWDVGIKNWFWLEVHNRAQLVNSNGFYHFWCSHKRSPKEIVRNNPCHRKDIMKWIEKSQVSFY